MANQQTNTPEEGAAIPIPLGGGDLFASEESWARPEEGGRRHGEPG